MLDRQMYEEGLQKAREQEMEELVGYLSDYIKLNGKIRDLPVFTQPDEEILDKLANIPIPRTGRDMKEVADELIKNVYENSMSIQHPRFFSLVGSAVSPYSMAAGILNNIYNLNNTGFAMSPGAAVIEDHLIDWMGSLAGYPETRSGIFTSGGSLSNMTGMIAARLNVLSEEEYPIGVAYLSDQAHISVAKGMKLMGLRKDQIRIIETDDNYKIRLDLLEDAIKEDIANGRKPFLLVGCLGSTNTGSIDPLPELADLKDKYGMWLHVDGAYGGSILLSDIYRNLAKGLERSDSFSWDTHKWAMQSYSCSCCLVRDKKKLVSAYAEYPEYLADIVDEKHTNGWDRSIEMSRPARALKFWFTVQAMGTDLLADVIDYAFYLANVSARKFKELPGWELTSPSMCGAITFRYVPETLDPSRYDELNAEISKRINDEHFAYVVTTVLKNRRVLRFCLINGNTTDEDVFVTIRRLDEIAHEVEAEMLSGKI